MSLEAQENYIGRMKIVTGVRLLLKSKDLCKYHWVISFNLLIILKGYKFNANQKRFLNYTIRDIKESKNYQSYRTKCTSNNSKIKVSFEYKISIRYASLSNPKIKVLRTP